MISTANNPKMLSGGRKKKLPKKVKKAKRPGPKAYAKAYPR
jgi:hypothetical protein